MVINIVQIEKGDVAEPRKQWAVVVHGRIDEYKEKGADFSCGCILDPELPTGLKTNRSFCISNCRVKIDYREYFDCTRREVLEYLIDFEMMHTIPRVVLENTPGREIREYEHP